MEAVCPTGKADRYGSKLWRCQCACGETIQVPYNNLEYAAQARKDAEVRLFDAVSAHYSKWRALSEKDPDWGEHHPVKVIVNQKDKKLTVALLPDLTGQQAKL